MQCVVVFVYLKYAYDPERCMRQSPIFHVKEITTQENKAQ